MEEQMYEFVIHAYLWFLLLVPVEEKNKFVMVIVHKWHKELSHKLHNKIARLKSILYTINRHVLEKQL